MVLVADLHHAETGGHEIIAVGDLIKLRGTREAEFALLVSDRYQRSGLGTEMLRRLVQIGRDEKLERITADVLQDNLGMQRVCEKLQFQFLYPTDSSPLQVVIAL
jgi:acetyltransferase